MASNSATKLATQQSIKAYVDAQVGSFDTLSEVLAQGNTSGTTNLVIDSGQVLTTNTVNETTVGAGVTIDSVLLKDDVVNATDIETSTISANDGTLAINIANTTGAVDIDTSLNVDGTVTIDGLTVDGNATVSGDVGIGTISPAKKVEIAGNNQALASNTTLRFTDTDTATQTNQHFGKIEFNSLDSSAVSPDRAYITAASENSLAGSYISFGTSAFTAAVSEKPMSASARVLRLPR
jgi:cytoskeletal protein CcmA (bactofilin family)